MEHERELMPSEVLQLAMARSQAARETKMETFKARRGGLMPKGWRRTLETMKVPWEPSPRA